jgi:hypothetical protein
MDSDRNSCGDSWIGSTNSRYRSPLLCSSYKKPHTYTHKREFTPRGAGGAIFPEVGSPGHNSRAHFRIRAWTLAQGQWIFTRGDPERSHHSSQRPSDLLAPCRRSGRLCFSVVRNPTHPPYAACLPLKSLST